MPVAELVELAKAGSYEAFETRCLQALENGQISLTQLVTAFRHFEQKGQAERLATLTQMIFENTDPLREPQAALELARIALIAAGKNAELLQRTIDLYRQVHGDKPGFDVVLQASGLTAGRPPRTALKLLDLCLTLASGDTLISRMDDHVVEVADVDRVNGLFTLRREGRTTTVPAAEVTREYDAIAPDDFRVLRQLRPQQLTTLIEDDPVKLVIGLIHAHGGHIDAELLKHELVPKYIEPKEWSRWWTKARGLLKRSPNVTIEGRAPVILSYSAEARTLEQESWDTLQGQNDAIAWMSCIEGYLREKAGRKEEPDVELLERFHGHVLKYILAVRPRRPAEALTCALMLDRLGTKGVPLTDESRALAGEMLRSADDPGLLLRGVEHEGLRERGMEVLQAARADDWVHFSLAWLPTASAGMLEKIATAAIDAGHGEAVQKFVDQALNDPARHPEVLVWLWKGPKRRAALRLPSDDELFRLMLDELSSLGRTEHAEAEVVKNFRHRVKAALALRDYDKAREVLSRISEAAAITIRRQIQRLEGLGENAPAKMLDLLRDAHPQLWVVRPKQVAPWQDAETIWCTGEGLARRVAERDDVLNVQMPDNARRIGEAAQHGDLSENSEYKFALEERDLLRARLAKANDEISRARVLDPLEVTTEHVAIGTRVTLRDTASGQTRVMTFLGPFETDVDRGFFSYQAPVSQKLMGSAAGTRVTLTLDGPDHEFEVVQIENALAR